MSAATPGEWVRLARPFTLTAAAVPVLFGTALALRDGGFRAGPFLAMLLASLLIQAATNMFNEYYDEKRGLDTADSVGIAGSIVGGKIPARSVLRAALGLYAVAFVLGMYLVAAGGWAILFLGLISALAGYLYTGGPRPISSTPASEATVFVFMGVLIVVIAYAVQAGEFPPGVTLAALPLGCPVAAILLANNIRDLDEDRRGGRRTLPIVLGRAGGIAVYRGLIAGTYILLVLLVISGAVPFTSLIAAASLPLAARLWRGVSASTVPARLMPVVKGTSGLHAVFGLLYALGVLISVPF
ncbi:MAG: 1,4-dihydroxy-2-naphthoate polyprenyltransferase [Rubrobacter sp.]|nr:1,4-dihydroxy-2-naphthoate polyprenyltransferase [Rubrobacter sp.]